MGLGQEQLCPGWLARELDFRQGPARLLLQPGHPGDIGTAQKETFQRVQREKHHAGFLQAHRKRGGGDWTLRELLICVCWPQWR